MSVKEIVFESPKGPEDSPGLHNILRGMEIIVPSIRDGEILNRFHSLVAATFLLSLDLKEYYLKAMHIEFPPYQQREFAKIDEPINALSLLHDGVLHAARKGIPGTLVLDVFAKQFENGKFNWRAYHPDAITASRTNSYTRQIFDLASTRSNFSMTVLRPPNRSMSVSTILSGIRNRNLHRIADGLPYSPLDLFRQHDHRKGMLYDLSSGDELAILQTFNFDNPLDIDCSFVSFDQVLVRTLKQLLKNDAPRNERIVGNGWTVHQDGSQDLDPLHPVDSSPIMSRVHELIDDPRTNSIKWTSQFLPDVETLHAIEARLHAGTLRHCAVYAPKPSLWSQFYRLSGGARSRVYAEKLARKYPHSFSLFYTTDRYLHAKTICINDHTLLLGSHNFNRTLVRARTSEIMLEQQMQPHTKQSLHKFYAELDQETRSIV